MKPITSFLLAFFIGISGISNAQLGINNQNPHESSLMDMYSTSKGLLTPRMTTQKRDSIVLPAQGLLIYNTTSSIFNYYDLGWKDFSDDYKTVSATNPIITTSLTNEVVSGMTLSPDAGTYSVNFNSQYTNTASVYYNMDTAQFITDLADLYNRLDNIPTTNDTHNFNFGNGETLLPGKYVVNSEIALGGRLILDALGNPDAVFIFKAVGALNLAAGSSIVLKGGAKACNVFWVSRGAVNIGAACIMKGTVMSIGFAVACGANTVFDGRLFTTEGAVAFGPGTATSPNELSATIDLKTLSNLLIFTGGGSLNNTGTTTVYNGNLSSHVGATISIAAATLNGVIFPPGKTFTVVNNGIINDNTFVTFSIYKNEILIPSSVRSIKCSSGSSCALIQEIVTVETGDVISVRWKSQGDPIELGNRNLTLIKVKSE
jgi:hypothetical protein